MSDNGIKIKDLKTINSIDANDYLIVEKPIGTRKISGSIFSKLATKDDLINKADISHRHNKDEIDGLDNIEVDLNNYYTKEQTYNKTEVEAKIAEASLSGEVDLSSYATKEELDGKADKIHAHSEYLTEHQDISGKVDKVEGKSLMLDTEIERLANVNNYNDSELKNLIHNKANITHSHDKSEIDGLSETEEKINALENNPLYIKNINTETFRDLISNTTYYVTEIKRQDVDGEIIKPKLGIANDSFNDGRVETCRSFSKRHDATIVINGGIFNMSNNRVESLLIKDGIVLNDASSNTNKILAWNDEGFFTAFDSSVNADMILSKGYTNAICGFDALIIDGKPHSGGSGVYNPRQAIGQRSNGDIIIITCDGRIGNNQGMDYDDLIRIFQTYDVRFAYNLDGGGSASTVVNGVKINNNIDSDGYTDRPVANFIYFTKENTTNKTKDITNIHDILGDLDQRIKKVVLDLFNIKNVNGGVLNMYANGATGRGLRAYDGNTHISSLNFRTDMLQYYDMISGQTMFEVNRDGQILTPKGALGLFNKNPKLIEISDLDKLTESGIYWVINATDIDGKSISYGVLNFYFRDDVKLQIAFPCDNTEGVPVKLRRNNGSSWYSWRNL